MRTCSFYNESTVRFYAFRRYTLLLMLSKTNLVNYLLQAFADEFRITFDETSANDPVNVEQAFLTMAADQIKKKQIAALNDETTPKSVHEYRKSMNETAQSGKLKSTRIHNVPEA
ncbi:hypothetical protein L6452_22629 [Arctium lappa]|uniref:Uncharacterized protein n=1 Tax=Arctium lappa TaxID=4217 RepID=A0ACB9B147_ARCLA|nr:hypothetical protein L6452_22629 [Arctium lappa]